MTVTTAIFLLKLCVATAFALAPLGVAFLLVCHYSGPSTYRKQAYGAAFTVIILAWMLTLLLALCYATPV